MRVSQTLAQASVCERGPGTGSVWTSYDVMAIEAMVRHLDASREQESDGERKALACAPDPGRTRDLNLDSPRRATAEHSCRRSYGRRCGRRRGLSARPRRTNLRTGRPGTPPS